MAARRSVTPSPAASVRAESFASAVSPVSSLTMPDAVFNASASGQNVIPSPYGRQRPPSTNARSPIRSRNSAVNLDLPTPASATRVARRADDVETASSKIAPSAPSSLSRPTKEAPARTSTSTMSFTRTSWYAGTGSDFPLSARGSTSFDVDAVADEPVGELAEEHLALAGRLLEAGRDVDGVPGDEALARGGIARDDLTRVDTCPVRELDAVDALQLAVELLERGLHPRRRANRAERVVLVQPRQARRPPSPRRR